MLRKYANALAQNGALTYFIFETYPELKISLSVQQRFLFILLHRCGESWCNPESERELTAMRADKSKTSSDDATSVRASISFPQELYDTLGEIARQKKVSLAWVVREAAEQYIADKWPLFKGRV